MNEKINRIKTKIKHYVPELIVATTMVAGVASAIYLLTHEQNDGEKLISIDPEEWQSLISGDDTFVDTDYGIIYMHIES